MMMIMMMMTMMMMMMMMITTVILIPSQEKTFLESNQKTSKFMTLIWVSKNLP